MNDQLPMFSQATLPDIGNAISSPALAAEPYALKLAGWDDREVWTGSCPCQPLSSAGQRKGHADERHLWPAFYRLIAECRPATVFGEQVASKDGLEWLAGVRADLEDAGYAVGAADLPAAGVGAPHIRQRLFWVADNAELRRDGHSTITGSTSASEGKGRLCEPSRNSPAGRLGDGEGELRGETRGNFGGPEKRLAGAGPWDDYAIIQCADGKARRIPTESALFPLAARIPGRVGLLRGAGNSIVPQVAAEVIRAYMEVPDALP